MFFLVLFSSFLKQDYSSTGLSHSSFDYTKLEFHYAKFKISFFVFVISRYEFSQLNYILWKYMTLCQKTPE